ncbi:MAG: hypothetical protein R6U13_07430 [Desulfatiglandaceae bacterium]
MQDLLVEALDQLQTDLGIQSSFDWERVKSYFTVDSLERVVAEYAQFMLGVEDESVADRVAAAS